jgi:hypothetical protein
MDESVVPDADDPLSHLSDEEYYAKREQEYEAYFNSDRWLPETLADLRGWTPEELKNKLAMMTPRELERVAPHLETLP